MRGDLFLVSKNIVRTVVISQQVAQLNVVVLRNFAVSYHQYAKADKKFTQNPCCEFVANC